MPRTARPSRRSSATRRNASAASRRARAGPRHSGSRRSASIASSGGRPNFEPWCAVLTASCVSASMPGVTRIRQRCRAERACALELVERVEHDQRPGLDRRLAAARPPCCSRGSRAGRRGCPARRANSSSPTVETSRAEPLLGEEPQHRDRRERLRPVDDERAGGRGGVRASLGAERRLVVDDERRPELAGELAWRARRRARARRPRRRRRREAVRRKELSVSGCMRSPSLHCGL